jgi:hypothetical protein
MGLSGKLETMPTPDLIQFLGMSRKTGMLVVRSGNSERQLWFEEGLLVSSRSDDPAEYLGQFLLQLGIVDENVLSGALKLAERQKRPLGMVMIEGGLLTEERLKEILVAKCYETIYNLFLWDRGTFEFVDGERIRGEHMRIAMDFNNVLMEGAYRVDQWKVIREVFPSDEVVVTRVPDKALDEDAEDATKKMLEDMGAASQSILALCMHVHRTKFWVYNQLLELKKARAIKISIPDPPEVAIQVMVEDSAAPAAPLAPASLDDTNREFSEFSDGPPDRGAEPGVAASAGEIDAALDGFFEAEPAPAPAPAPAPVERPRSAPPPIEHEHAEIPPIDLGELDVQIQLVAEAPGGKARASLPPAAPPQSQVSPPGRALIPPPPPPRRIPTAPPPGGDAAASFGPSTQSGIRSPGTGQIVPPPPPPPRGRQSNTWSMSPADAIATARTQAVQGHYEQSFALLRACLEADASNSEARDALAEMEWDFQERVLAERFTFMSIPKIVKPLSEIIKLKLSPTEAFLLSRINGSVDVGSIVAISPLKKIDVLLGLCKLIDQGIVAVAAGLG